MSNPDSRPLPEGWITQFNPDYKEWFYVNTKAPGGPKSQWTHPAEDQPTDQKYASPSGPPPPKTKSDNTYGNAPQAQVSEANQSSGKRGFFSKLTGKSSQPQQQYYQQPPPPQNYGGYPQQGYPQQGYGGYPQQGYGGYPQQPMMMQQAGRRPMGGMGAGGGAMLGLGGGLLGGMLIGDMISDNQHDAYMDGYQDGQMNDMDGGGDFGGGDFGGGDF